LLGKIYSGIPHRRTGEDAKEFAWLRFDMDKADNSVKILIDELKGRGLVAS
jgi:hypothetical protein